MPPPPPLLLSGIGNKRQITKAPTPSPLESPQEALNLIQAQLRRLEQPNRDSTESIGRRMELLDNLEQEMMGMEENKRQLMDRASVSSFGTDSRPNSVAMTVSREASTRSIAADRRASRRERLENASRSRSRSRSQSRSRADHVAVTTSSEAQQEYAENAPCLIEKINNVAPEQEISKVLQPAQHARQLWTPSAPEDSRQEGALWTAPAPKRTDLFDSADLPGLSVRPAARKSTEALTIESARLWQKPAETQKSETRGLWTKGVPAPAPRPKSRPVIQRPPRRSRRVTMLPDICKCFIPTLYHLAVTNDENQIVESPQPLPNSDAELGIFQFPWGEKNSTGSMQPAPIAPAFPRFMPMPGTMASGGQRVNAALDARSRQIEADEYSSSFFDDYDEESGDNFDDDYYDSEDDFDETTLWEIAGLLKTENLPSKNSILPRPYSETLEDGYPQMPTDDEEEYAEASATDLVLNARETDETRRSSLWAASAVTDHQHTSYGLPQPDQTTWDKYMPSDDIVRAPTRFDEEMTPLESYQLWASAAPRALSTLWEVNSVLEETRYQGHGLPQPEQDIWESYIPSQEGAVRSQPLRSMEVSSIESTELWMPKPEHPSSVSGLLWTSSESSEPKMVTKSQSQALWEQAPVREETQTEGLFDVNAYRADFRGTAASPAAIDMMTKPRKSEEPLPVLSSRQLWGSLVSPARAALLWEPAPIRNEVETDGLFNPKAYRADYRSTSAPAVAIDMIRKPRKSEEPLPVLLTRQLWGSTLSQARALLWEQAPARDESQTDGLFDVNAYRADFRSTSAPPAAIDMIRKPRKSDEPLPKLTSQQLWKYPRMVSKDTSNQPLLWSAPSTPLTPSFGLFSVDPERKVFRTTDAEPAALDMTTKPRKDRAPLARLESTRLWRANNRGDEEVDWITISSIRPRSPSLDSIASTMSSPRTPKSDGSSVRSYTTKASTIAPSMRTAFSNRGLFGMKDDIPEVPESPEPIGMPRVPEMPEEVAPKPKQPKTPLRQQFRPTVIYNGDWDAALQEAIKASQDGPDWDGELADAIKASHIAPKMVRKEASPRDWSRALQEAIAKSYPQTRFSRGQILPEEWEAELREAIERSKRAEEKKEAKARRSLVRNQLAQLQEKLAAKSAPKSPEQVEAQQKSNRVRNQIAALQTALAAKSAKSSPTTSSAPSPKSPQEEAEEKASLVRNQLALIQQQISRNHRKKSNDFDVTLRHPVFAGLSLATDAQFVHPAAMILPMPPSPVALWSKPASETGSTGSSAMWSPSSAPARAVSPVDDSNLIIQEDAPRYNSPRPADEAVTADFGRDGMWSRQQPQEEEEDTNWLDHSVNHEQRFSRVVLRY